MDREKIEKDIFNNFKSLLDKEDDFFDALEEFVQISNKAINKANLLYATKTDCSENTTFLISQPCGGWEELTVGELLKASQNEKN